jgi:hypothetical protein
MTDDILANLRMRLKTIESETEHLEKLAEGYRMVIADCEQHSGLDSVPHLKRVPKEARNTAVLIIREEGQALHYKDIYVRMKNRGVEVRGESPARNLIAHMSQDARFVSVGSGMWTLKSITGN